MFFSLYCLQMTSSSSSSSSSSRKKLLTPENVLHLSRSGILEKWSGPYDDFKKKFAKLYERRAEKARKTGITTAFCDPTPRTLPKGGTHMIYTKYFFLQHLTIMLYSDLEGILKDDYGINHGDVSTGDELGKALKVLQTEPCLFISHPNSRHEVCIHISRTNVGNSSVVSSIKYDVLAGPKLPEQFTHSYVAGSLYDLILIIDEYFGKVADYAIEIPDEDDEDAGSKNIESFGTNTTQNTGGGFNSGDMETLGPDPHHHHHHESPVLGEDCFLFDPQTGSLEL